GLCVGHVLHSPRGLRKVDTVGKERAAFLGRFAMIANADGAPVPNWNTWGADQKSPDQLPRGNEDEYVLEEGVETWSLATTSNYQNMYWQLRGSVEGPSWVKEKKK